MPPPADLDSLSNADLKSLVLKLLEEVAELRRTVAAQRDEIARLKGGPCRPNIKPSGMDKATEPKPSSSAGSEPRPTGGKTSKLSIHEERTVKVTAPPEGSRFKGYTSYIVQDLVIRSHVVNFRRERWQGPGGDVVTAPPGRHQRAFLGRNCAASYWPNTIRDKSRCRGCWRPALRQQRRIADGTR